MAGHKNESVRSSEIQVFFLFLVPINFVPNHGQNTSPSWLKFEMLGMCPSLKSFFQVKLISLDNAILTILWAVER